MAYQMILVDDEILAIEGVKSDLDLQKLGISRLFTAYNVEQAKEIFDQEVIDIMLCDIEMPQETGLALLSWVREKYPNTVAIFLTSHADFKYAKEALRLGSLDFLLKPVMADDLEQVIRRAQDIIDQTSEISRSLQSHQLWMKHQSLIVERFWLDLINHTIPSNPMVIREQAERKRIPIIEDMIFLPVLISVQRWNKALDGRDKKIMEYALKNTAEEIISVDHSNGIFFYVDQGMLLGIFADSRNREWNISSLAAACSQFIESCNEYFYCDLSCYIGELVEAQAMAAMITKLREQDQNNVAFTNQVFTYAEGKHAEQKVKLPEINLWSSILKTGTREALIEEVDKYFHHIVENNVIDASLLHRFQQDFLQALYSYLNQRGIQAHQLFGDEESKGASAAAGRSVKDMLAWVRHAVNRAVDQAEAVEESTNIVETVKQYIAQNMDQDLSRESLASMVFLNRDHLTRIFKKETGFLISEYVLMERINLAKKLLSQTEIPISSIATSLGYSNFSHFAKMFKKVVEMGPSEYRMQIREPGTEHEKSKKS